jgi:heme/copper-type cytochrome/quinol oxidase subunit 2
LALQRRQPHPGSVIDFYVTSKDVVHGFFIEGTNINLMAVPAAVTYAQTRFEEPGKHMIRRSLQRQSHGLIEL